MLSVGPGEWHHGCVKRVIFGVVSAIEDDRINGADIGVVTVTATSTSANSSSSWWRQRCVHPLLAEYSAPDVPLPSRRR